MVDMIDLEKQNNSTELLNKIFLFRDEHNMGEMCILDILTEFAYKNNLDTELLAMELSDMPSFVELVELDMLKFKYSRPDLTNPPISEDWEEA